LIVGQELQAAEQDLLSPPAGGLLVAPVVHRERVRKVCGRAVTIVTNRSGAPRGVSTIHTVLAETSHGCNVKP